MIRHKTQTHTSHIWIDDWMIRLKKRNGEPLGLVLASIYAIIYSFRHHAVGGGFTGTVGYLAKRTCQSKRTVQRQLRVLQGEGLIRECAGAGIGSSPRAWEAIDKDERADPADTDPHDSIEDYTHIDLDGNNAPDAGPLRQKNQDIPGVTDCHPSPEPVENSPRGDKMSPLMPVENPSRGDRLTPPRGDRLSPPYIYLNPIDSKPNALSTVPTTQPAQLPALKESEGQRAKTSSTKEEQDGFEHLLSLSVKQTPKHKIQDTYVAYRGRCHEGYTPHQILACYKDYWADQLHSHKDVYLAKRYTKNLLRWLKEPDGLALSAPQKKPCTQSLPPHKKTTTEKQDELAEQDGTYRSLLWGARQLSFQALKNADSAQAAHEAWKKADDYFAARNKPP